MHRLSGNGRREYGGMEVSQAHRLKELEKENARLRKAISDLTLDKLILNEALTGPTDKGESRARNPLTWPSSVPLSLCGEAQRHLNCD